MRRCCFPSKKRRKSSRIWVPERGSISVRIAAGWICLFRGLVEGFDPGGGVGGLVVSAVEVGEAVAGGERDEVAAHAEVERAGLVGEAAAVREEGPLPEEIVWSDGEDGVGVAGDDETVGGELAGWVGGAVGIGERGGDFPGGEAVRAGAVGAGDLGCGGGGEEEGGE